MAPEWKGAMYAVIGMALLFGLWQFATSESRDRGDGSMTGFDRGANSPPMQQAQQADPAAQAREAEFRKQIAMLEAKLETNADDLATRSRLTRLYLNVSGTGRRCSTTTPRSRPTRRIATRALTAGCSA
ncbi:MAG: hypothetical protein R3F59_29740 [Myxococcota bacterium]